MAQNQGLSNNSKERNPELMNSVLPPGDLSGLGHMWDGNATGSWAEESATSFDPFNAEAFEDEESPTRQEMKVLLRRLSAGDSTAFWCLWEMHRDYLYGVCFNKMGGVREDAEDALSSAMMKAWDNLPRYAEAIINLRAWLTRLTCNLCIDMHRERNRQARVVISIEKINMDELSLTCTLESPEQAFFYRELCMHVRWRVQELPYPLRTAFILRFVHEMPYREIAERLILSTDNVRKRVQLARAILCTQLKGIFRD